MDKNKQGHYRQQQQQQQGGGSNTYPWNQNGMISPPSSTYVGQGPPPQMSGASRHPLPAPPSHQSYQGGSGMYYNQPYPVAGQNSTAPYAGVGGASASQPYQAQQGYPPYGQQMNNMNPWAQYNDAATAQKPYSPPGVSSGIQSNLGHHANYNQYNAYPPPSNQSTGGQGNSLPNQNQGQNMGYPYYQMPQQQQPQSNYYYPQSQQSFQNGVLPPPLPPNSQPPPPLPPSQKPSYEQASGSTPSRASTSGSSSPSPVTKKSDERAASKSTDTDSRVGKDKRPLEEDKDEKETKKAVPIMVGKRRGGRVLPTGVVKKQKTDDNASKGKSDAWSQYMAEVRRYKDQSCTEERQNRPLVK